MLAARNALVECVRSNPKIAGIAMTGDVLHRKGKLITLHAAQDVSLGNTPDQLPCHHAFSTPKNQSTP